MPSAAAAAAVPEREPRWASLDEAAIYSRVPRSTLRRWIAQGRLPAVRFGPRRIEVDLNELDALRQPIPTEGNIALSSQQATVQTADDGHVKSRQSEFERAGNG